LVATIRFFSASDSFTAQPAQQHLHVIVDLIQQIDQFKAFAAGPAAPGDLPSGSFQFQAATALGALKGWRIFFHRTLFMRYSPDDFFRQNAFCRLNSSTAFY
jgi:hypothetical protein